MDAETVPETKAQRLKILDIYKGMAIMGVIITHLVLLQNGTNGKEGDPSAVVQFMFSGLFMFMLVSGYFYKPGGTYLEKVKKRVVPLVVIYVAAIVVMTLLTFAYMAIIGYDLTPYCSPFELISKVLIGKNAFLEIGSEAFIAATNTLAPFEVTIMMYYLGILALGYLIFYAIADRVLKDWRITIVTAVVLFLISSLYIEFVGIQLPFFAIYAPLVAAFLLIGALMAKYNFAGLLQDGYKTKKFWIGLAIALVCMVTCLILFPANTDVVYVEIGDYGAFSVLTLAATSLSCGIVQLYIASLFMRIPGVSHLFSAMGFNVLYLFLLHVMVAKIIIAPFVEIGIDYIIPLDFVPALILAFGTIAAILVMSYIYRRIKPMMLEKVSNKKGTSET